MTPAQREYSIASGPDSFKNQLLKQFPNEVKGIETFFTLLKKAYRPQGTMAWFGVKLLPLWLVNALNYFGLPTYLSNFYSLSHRSAKDVVEVSQQTNELPQIVKFYLSIIDISLKEFDEEQGPAVFVIVQHRWLRLTAQSSELLDDGAVACPLL